MLRYVHGRRAMCRGAKLSLFVEQSGYQPARASRVLRIASHDQAYLGAGRHRLYHRGAQEFLDSNALTSGLGSAQAPTLAT